MATMSELNAEYQILKATHERLIEERASLHASDAGGAAFQDHAHRTRVYAAAVESYRMKLEARRHELGSRTATPTAPRTR